MELTSWDIFFSLLRLAVCFSLMYWQGLVIGILVSFAIYEVINTVMYYGLGYQPMKNMDSIFMLDHERNRSFVIVPYVHEKFKDIQALKTYMHTEYGKEERLRCVNKKFAGIHYFRRLNDKEFLAIKDEYVNIIKKEMT
jgi:hypothetical protein